MQVSFNDRNNSTHATRSLTLLPTDTGNLYLQLAHQFTVGGIATSTSLEFAVRDDELPNLIQSLTQIAVDQGILPAPRCCYHPTQPAVGCPSCHCNSCGDPLAVTVTTPTPPVCADCTDCAAEPVILAP